MFVKYFEISILLCLASPLLLVTQYCQKLHLLPITNRQEAKNAMASMEPVLGKLKQENPLK